MVTAKLVQGMLPGVDRPALASAFPTLNGKPAVMVDVGANVDCTPRMLAQFAVMGDIYARVILHTENPRVGLLSIGEEEHKGNDLTRKAYALLKTLPLNFIGNVEGGDIYSGETDVIVCDGFIGNVALKVSEGLVDVIKQHAEGVAAKSTIAGKIGYVLSAPPSPTSRSAWTTPNTAARRCWASAGSASSATAAPTPTPSRTPSAWRPQFSSGQINHRIEHELRRWPRRPRWLPPRSTDVKRSRNRRTVPARSACWPA